jgi:hypothetical protein
MSAFCSTSHVRCLVLLDLWACGQRASRCPQTHRLRGPPSGVRRLAGPRPVGGGGRRTRDGFIVTRGGSLIFLCTVGPKQPKHSVVIEVRVDRDSEPFLGSALGRWWRARTSRCPVPVRGRSAPLPYKSSWQEPPVAVGLNLLRRPAGAVDVVEATPSTRNYDARLTTKTSMARTNVARTRTVSCETAALSMDRLRHRKSSATTGMLIARRLCGWVHRNPAVAEARTSSRLPIGGLF